MQKFQFNPVDNLTGGEFSSSTWTTLFQMPESTAQVKSTMSGTTISNREDDSKYLITVV